MAKRAGKQQVKAEVVAPPAEELLNEFLVTFQFRVKIASDTLLPVQLTDQLRKSLRIELINANLDRLKRKANAESQSSTA